MGKKSLTKSTTKKKTKKTAAKKATTKKTATKAAVNKTAVKKSTPKKSAKATKKKITLKDLIFKKFDTWKPEKFFKVETDKEALKAYAAPPFITGSPDDMNRIKEILFRKFDPETMRKQIEELKAAAEKAAEEKAEAERKAAVEKAAREKAEAEKKAAEEKAAAEKAAMEKAEAEKKAAEEKAAKEKAEAERKAAEKAAAEKAAEEKAEAEKKAAAEKIAAEKAAKEKAAKEKVAAEKAAREKAAKEKAAAERAALERAAAEKAAAEKAAAKKEAAEKKAVEMKRNIIAAGAGFALILLMLIGVSFSNMSNFYLKPVEDGIEIRRGAFAPVGQRKYFVLQGAELQEPVKKVYSKKDVYPLIFNAYIEQADSLLETTAIPDFDGIRHSLDNALKYGITAELRETAQSRLNRIDFMILVYKADIAAAKDSLASLKSAMTYYKEAAGLNPAEHQVQQLKRKIESVSQKIFLIEQQAVIEPEKETEAEKEIPAVEDNDMPEAAEHSE